MHALKAPELLELSHPELGSEEGPHLFPYFIFWEPVAAEAPTWPAKKVCCDGWSFITFNVEAMA